METSHAFVQDAIAGNNKVDRALDSPRLTRFTSQVNPEILALLDSSSSTGTAVLRDGRRVFLKRRTGVPSDFFTVEAAGLRALAAARALRVPEVHAVSGHGIVIEDLGSGKPTADDWEAAGRGLALLHRAKVAQFGFDMDGYCGDSPQNNHRDADGHRFFAERRLIFQAQRAFDRHRIERRDIERIEALCARLRDLLPECSPVLIHGDLWTGNLHACDSGELALIDGGAAHHGWAECDLAMLTLFGEPPRAFFAAYEAEARIDSTWRSHAPLLNLYHLLNHLNLFGGDYLAGVRSTLDKLVGTGPFEIRSP
ncbi:MAG TPA: fructosamine kinase family protein [Rudaea sp.]